MAQTIVGLDIGSHTIKAVLFIPRGITGGRIIAFRSLDIAACGGIEPAIKKLADTNVSISTTWKTTSNQTIGQYYASLVTTVGADTKLAKTNSEYHTTLTSDLKEQTSSASGVNLDEEMANLIKYQHSYTAAAKLITTADQMMQTLLGLKQ